MSDFSTDTNTERFQAAVKAAKLRFPVTEIATRLNYSKGNVSAFLNGKKPVPLEFLENFLKTFNVTDEMISQYLSLSGEENTTVASEDLAEYQIDKLHLLIQEKDLRISDKDKIIELQEIEINRLKNELNDIKSQKTFVKKIDK